MEGRNPWIFPAAVFLTMAFLAAVAFGGSAIAQGFVSQGPGTSSILRLPDNYSTIQGAIDAARSDHVIPMAPGKHNENITLNLAVASAMPPAASASPAPTKIPQAKAPPLIGILSLSPTSAANGTSVMLTITGFGFRSGTAIGFRGGRGTAPQVAAVQFASSTSMIATINAVDSTPRPQTWDVRVTNPDGTAFLLVSAFTVNP